MTTMNVFDSVINLRRYKCVRVPVRSAETIVRAAQRAGLRPNGGALSPDGRYKWLYLN